MLSTKVNSFIIEFIPNRRRTGDCAHLVHDEIADLLEQDDDLAGVAVVARVRPDEADDVHERLEAGAHVREVRLLQSVEVSDERLQELADVLGFRQSFSARKHRV